MNKSIYALAQDSARNYRNESSRMDVVEGLPFFMYETIRETEFLTTGHYTTGDYDENGDIKPFHDILTRLLENQRSAEEVDIADLEMVTDDSDYYTRAMLISKFNQDWMYKKNIGKFLNEAIESRGKYGGVMVKVVESSEDLDLEVVDWNSFNGDPMDLRSGIKVVNNFYTPSQLIEVAKKRGWNLENAIKAIELYKETDIADDNKEQKETMGNYILVREVSGDLPRSYLEEKADEHDFVHQIHYIAGTELQDDEGNSKGVTLFASELEKSPYYYLPYKKRNASDRLLGIGVTERARHGQIQTNRAAQQYKRAIDFASTHVLQSASKNLKGKNVLTGIKAGTILQHDDGKPISGVDMSPQALQHLDRYLAVWQNQVDRATQTNAISTGAGEKLPADMTYRLGAILDQNSQSSFDLRREEFDIFMNEIYTERVLPWMIKQIKKKSVLKLKFSAEELMKLDEDVSNYKADQSVIDNYFNGAYDNLPPMMKFVAMNEDKIFLMQGLQGDLRRQKSRRNITDFPDGYWEQVADKLYVSITNERKRRGVVAERVQNALMQYMQYKPLLDQDPEARSMFDNIMVASGLNPIDWTATPQPQVPQGDLPAPKQTGSQSALENPEQLTARPD